MLGVLHQAVVALRFWRSGPMFERPVVFPSVPRADVCHAGD